MSLLFTRIFSRQSLQECRSLRALSSSSLNFVAQRTDYKEKMSQLRKEWQIEHQNKLDKIKSEKEAEDKQTVLRRAVRLRQTRLDSAIRIEEARKAREEAMDRYRNKLARNHILMAEKEARQQRRYAVAVSDLEKEREAWITLDNVDQKITDELFKNPSTTGLTTKHSDHWRYQAFSVDLKRMEHDERMAQENPDMYGKRLMAERDLIRRFDAESYLNTVIGSGTEREKFPQLVKEYMDTVFTRENDDGGHFSELDGVDDVDDRREIGVYYNQLMRQVDPEDGGGSLTGAGRDQDEEDEDEDGEVDLSFNPFADALDEADREQLADSAAKAAENRKKKGAAGGKSKPVAKKGRSAPMRKIGKK